jgi:hypothetical protein
VTIASGAHLSQRSVDVEVDPEEDKRPEEDGRRAERTSLTMRTVM